MHGLNARQDADEDRACAVRASSRAPGPDCGTSGLLSGAERWVSVKALRFQGGGGHEKLGDLREVD